MRCAAPRMSGDRAAMFIALVICTAAFTTINAAIFTGARTTWAMGRDFAAFAKLGVWRNSGSTPVNALLLQALITLALIAAGSRTQDGFQAMVAYTAPVFWTFFLLTAITLFVFRRRAGASPGFRVPLFPLVPLAFCAACLYMLYSSINYVRYTVEFGVAVFAGLVIMAAGIPLYFLIRGK
jgi:basic amino acid/polyamine antiporter, APA family